MIGAGVFAAFAPAAAPLEACCSSVWASPRSWPTATRRRRRSSRRSTRRPAAPTSTDASGSGAWWGFLAGWGFVVGKTASCAAMALTFAAYAVARPEWVQRLVALAAVVALTAVNYCGHHEDRREWRGCCWPSPSSRSWWWWRQSLDVWRSTSHLDDGDLVDRRSVRRAPVGRADVLRVRRLRADRHARGGGPRPGDDDPACDPAGPGHRRRAVRRRARSCCSSALGARGCRRRGTPPR